MKLHHIFLTRLLCLILIQGLSFNIFAQDKKVLIDRVFTLAEKNYTALSHSLETYDKYPRTIDEKNTLKFDRGTDWTGGFWPGSLLYVYEYAGDTLLRNEALRFIATLARNQYNIRHHDVGFVMYNSYGNAYRLLGHPPEYKKVLLQSAESLTHRYSPKVGSIKSWNCKKSGDGVTVWHFPVIIDNLMNLELLFFASKVSGNPKYKDIAIQHAETTLKNHIRPDYSCYHVVDYDEHTGKVLHRETAQGFAHNSTWARGQAWGIYGFTMIYRETRDKRFLKAARKMADFYIDHPNLPQDKIPYWDFNVNQEGFTPVVKYEPAAYPVIPRDASAAAVTASGLIELSSYLPVKERKKYSDAAIQIIRSLSKEPYLNKSGEEHKFLLNHSVGNFPGGSEIDVPIVYADYYFLEALLRYKRSDLK